MNDLTPERLADVLGGRRWEFYEQIGSSNDRAMALLGEGAAAGTVVIADEQTQGRGRLGRNWHSPPGSALMLSYLMRPSVEAVGDAGMAGALAVCQTIQAMGAADAGIKWPNDVQIDRLKVCGILPESAWQGDALTDDALTGVVLGMGLNVRVDFAGSPLAQTAISLETAVGQVDRLDLLLRLLARLDDWAARMGTDDLFRAWRSHLNMLGRDVTVENAGLTISGTAEMVSRDGALHLRGSDGILRRVVAGDIALG